MKTYYLTILVLFSIISCSYEKENNKDSIKLENYTDIIPLEFIASSFDFPINKPNAKGYYNAQKFKENNHLGEDWNSIKGGNSDLGDPIYSIANGFVKETKNYSGGWGNVVRIIHYLPNNNKVESLYAHCDTILIKQNSWVKKGDKIATIGTANGRYLAHLHFEIRSNTYLSIGNGYSENTSGYLNPTSFIKKHRNIKNER